MDRPTAALLDTYRQHRQMAIALLQDRIINLLSKKQLEAAAKQLGLYHKKTLYVENEAELDVLFNYAIFHCRSGDKNIVDRYWGLQQHKVLLEMEWQLMEALRKAQFGILSVVETYRYGGLKVDDLLNEQQFLLMDEGFSKSARPGFIIATDYIQLPSFIMTTGAGLPLNPVIHALDETFDAFFDKPPYPEMSLAMKSKFVTRLLKNCLQAGATHYICYQ